MAALVLRKLRPRPRAKAASPAYPALLCAAMVAIAAVGCSEAVEEEPDGGQGEDAALAEGGHAFAEAGVADAPEEGTEDQLNSGGCSAAPYRAGTSTAWTMAAVLLCVKRRRRSQ